MWLVGERRERRELLPVHEVATQHGQPRAGERAKQRAKRLRRTTAGRESSGR